MKYSVFFISALLLLAVACSETVCQQSLLSDRSKYYDYGKKIYAEDYYLPYKSEDSIRVIILFRIANDVLTFSLMKNPANSKDGYYTIPTVEVEFKDSENIIRKREIWSDTVIVESYEMASSKTDFIFGAIEAVLAVGSYSGEITFLNNFKQIIKRNKLSGVSDPQFLKKSMIGKPIFAHSFNPDKNKVISPFVLENGISFSSKGASILVPVTFLSGFDKFTYRLRYIGQKKRIMDWSANVDLSDNITPEKNLSIRLVNNSKEERSNDSIKLELSEFSYSETTSQYKLGLLNISLGAENLYPGTYELKIVRGNSKDTLSQDFDVIWEDMPFSLYNPEYAADRMYYILTDDEFDEMTGGNEKEISKKILDYWKKHDPTPFTPYNEAMAAYFRRVDYASLNFQTLTEKDGSKTDRGKIYILKGAPDTINRELKEDRSMEIWRYKLEKKDYIFESLSSGNYILVQIIDFKS